MENVMTASRPSFFNIFSLLLPAIALISTISVARAAEVMPRVVINAPSSQGLQQMISDDDQWITARAGTDGLLTVPNIAKAFSDDELQQFGTRMKSWRKTLDLEVGAIKEWSLDGEKSFQMQKGDFDRLTRHGLDIGSFAMDEPLSKALSLHKSEDFAVEQTARFILTVRKNYPQALIGDIEPYPSQNIDEHIRWIDRLQQRLHQLGDKGLDFYRVDPDWVSFQVAHKGSWAELKKIEDHCHSAGLKFSLIYWDSDFWQAKNAGTLNDKTWYDGILKEEHAYAAAGGKPDQFVIESWIGQPKAVIPDSEPYTFTNSVRDFVRLIRGGTTTTESSNAAKQIWLAFGPGGPAEAAPPHPPAWWGKRQDGRLMLTSQGVGQWPVTLAHTTTVLTSGRGIAVACLENKPDASWKNCADLQMDGEYSLDQYFRNIKARHMTFALEIGLLVDTLTNSSKINRTCGSEAVGREPELRLVLRKIKLAGGNLDYLRMDEPFYYGVISCHETPEHVAQYLHRTIDGIVRSYFPDVKIGDVEPVSGAADAAQTITAWADAYRKELGTPLAFFHADAAWLSGIPARNFPALQQAMHQRGISFGIIYDGESDASSTVWTNGAIEHFTQAESVLKTPIDQAIFMSWTAEPDAILPEKKLGTLTNVSYQYVLPQTSLAANVVNGKAVHVSLAASGNRPIAGARIDGEWIDTEARSRDLPKRSISGITPSGTAYAVVGIRANTEGSAAAANGEAYLGPIAVHYTAASGEQRLWRSSYTAPKQLPISPEGRIVTNLPGSASACGLSVIPVAAQSPFTLETAFAATKSADHAGYVTMIFFDAQCHGLTREFLYFTPVTKPLSFSETDAGGNAGAALPASWLANGGKLRLRYSGDNAEHRPVETSIPLQ